MCTRLLAPLALSLLLANTAGAQSPPSPSPTQPSTPPTTDRMPPADTTPSTPAMERRGPPDAVDSIERGAVDTPSDGAMATGPDAAFYREALASGTGEVALSRHAVEHAASRAVRTFAKTMVDDHTALNAKLMAASGMTSAPLPPPADKQHAEMVMAASGPQYDSAWLEHMSMGHKKSIALYDATSRSAADPKTRALAKAALPKLRAHAATVESLRSGMSPKR